MASAFIDETRAAIWVEGGDAETFLQGLLTNDVTRAGPDRAVYAAMLTPQGKFLFDMMAARPSPERFVLDVAADRAAALTQRLSMYKLRADVKITPAADLKAAAILSEDAPSLGADAIAFPDPRHPSLGWRVLTADVASIATAYAPADAEAYARRLIEAGAPRAGLDLIADETFPLDADFERLGGVDFKKGCYVGQEVTARMKHKTERRKRLYRLSFDGPTPATGSDVLVGGRSAGRVGSALNDAGLAVLRVDRVAGAEALTVGDARATATPID